MSATTLCYECKITPGTYTVIFVHDGRVVCSFNSLNLIFTQQLRNGGALIGNVTVGVVDHQIVSQIVREQLPNRLTIDQGFC